MISLIDFSRNKKIGYFKSYKDIGEYLSVNGETGKYYAVPKNIKSIVGMKEINVKKYSDDDIEIEMEGSYY